MENDQEKKKFIMKVGIISIMILILVFWILNAKNVFKSNQTAPTSDNKEQLQDIKDEFNSVVDKLGESLDKIEATDERLKAASSSLVNEFVDGVNEIASSTAASSSVATSSVPNTPNILPIPKKINSNCPAYINCMPTIGEARPCQIPAGCEGITQIAY